MNFDLTTRRVLAVFALIPFALLAEGLNLQHLQGQPPCPLCVLQRGAFFAIGAIALVAVVQGPRRRGAALYAAAMSLVAAAGLAVAIWQVWTLYHPKFGCGVDVMEEFVNQLPTAKLLPFLFHASGDCSARYAPLFGLQVPEWAIVWFSAFLFGAVFFAFKWWRAAPAADAA